LPPAANSRIARQNACRPSTSIATVGLVEHEQLGVAHERDRKAGPLRLTSGELLGPPLRELVDPRQVEHLVDAERVGIERGHHGDELANREVADQGAGLEHRSDRARVDRRGRFHPEQRDRAVVGLGQAEQHVDRGGLAGSVRPEQRDGLAPSDRHIDRANRVHRALRRAERPGQPAQLDPAVLSLSHRNHGTR
jgi:hypothetical protein